MTISENDPSSQIVNGCLVTPGVHHAKPSNSKAINMSYNSIREVQKTGRTIRVKEGREWKEYDEYAWVTVNNIFYIVPKLNNSYNNEAADA